MTQHTKTPWIHTGTDFINKARLIDHEDGMIEVYGKNREANAAFIVRAVNSHEALVEALEMIAGIRLCPDNLMSNADIAKAAIALAKVSQ